MRGVPKSLLCFAWLSFNACTGASVRDANTAPTREVHRAFPIASGPHAQTCATCHGTTSSFTDFSCLNCHGHEQALTDSLHTTVAKYEYTSTGCYMCHTNGARHPFDHPGITAGCAACHDANMPFAALPISGFTHVPFTGDCSSCHVTTTWLSSSEPTTLVSDPLRSIGLSALIPTYAGPTITTMTPQTQTLAMPMDHTSAAVSSDAASSCSNCHLDASAGVFYPGDFHSSLLTLGLPAPTMCNDCHLVSMPHGFVGPTATQPARAPSSGEMKHDAVVWNGTIPTTDSAVPYDCGICHLAPAQTGAAWNIALDGNTPARFHVTGVTAASCLDCHANTRPQGVLTSATVNLPANVSFDHSQALEDCNGCHVASTRTWQSWSGAMYHLAGTATPTSCLPCHAAERPTSTAGWTVAPSLDQQFDTTTNAAGIGHGGNLDCAVCHNGPGTGAWGGTQNWLGGAFSHSPQTLAASTCIACHMSSRPDLQPGANTASVASLLGFDHSINGTGDCYGCHQSTVTSGAYAHYYNTSTHALPNGDWRGGESYPGSTLVGSPNQFVVVTEWTLQGAPRGLVTGAISTRATLYNQMLHTSTAIPATMQPGPANNPNDAMCHLCHASSGGTVTSYANGEFHASVSNAAQVQPTAGCRDCHGPMRPAGIVERAASDLRSMDHNAMFTAPTSIGGVTAAGVSDLDCSTCHAQPGSAWNDGVFHTKIGAAMPSQCVNCHYLLMADASASDVTLGTSYAMRHRSALMVTQQCQACHTSALGAATQATPTAGLWKPGSFHGGTSAQPTACNDCHTVSVPAAQASTQSNVVYALSAGATSTNEAQWMNHGASDVVGKDCVTCHLADAKASGAAWSKGDSLHAAVKTPAACNVCHGLSNGGGSTPGTNNNLPSGVVKTTTLTTASNDSATGVPAGTYDQINHSDINVTSHECNFCHTQAGASSTPGIQGKEWAQAKFHANFTAASPLTLGTSTGRCSNCHLNVKPTSSFTAFNHSAFTSASGTQDCASCHSWPGTGTTSAPNWLGAAGSPQYITVGGFNVSQPPATSVSVQNGITNLPHPSTSSGVSCTQCHATAAGGTNATGYDHASALTNSNCNACHEAGSNLVGTPWNGVTSQSSAAGDTRPYTLTSVVAHKGGSTLTVRAANHFYPVDCAQCHTAPSGVVQTSTGSTYLSGGSGRWSFPHNEGKMTNPSTCLMCHTNGVP